LLALPFAGSARHRRCRAGWRAGFPAPAAAHCVRWSWSGADSALTPVPPPDSQRGSALVQVLRKIAGAWITGHDAALSGGP